MSRLETYIYWLMQCSVLYRRILFYLWLETGYVVLAIASCNQNLYSLEEGVNYIKGKLYFNKIAGNNLTGCCIGTKKYKAMQNYYVAMTTQQQPWSSARAESYWRLTEGTKQNVWIGSKIKLVVSNLSTCLNTVSAFFHVQAVKIISWLWLLTYSVLYSLPALYLES